MSKRKSKKPQQEDTSIVLKSSVSQSRRGIKPYASPVLLFIIILTVGACTMGWFCAQQQRSLDELSESFTTMHTRITNLQQVMELTDAQTDAGLGVEERIFAMEEAQKQALEKAEVALATSEELKKSDLHTQLLALRDEMQVRIAETRHVSLSITTLQAMFKNQSEEFEAVKESVVAGLSSSSALVENVAGLTGAVVRACSRVDEQVAAVEALSAQLEGHASEMNELKESLHLKNVALRTNSQEMAAIKELIKADQAMRAQALEEMLSSVQMTLDEQFFTSQTLHSSVRAQLQTFYTKLAYAPSPSMKIQSTEEAPAAEESVSSTAQNATEAHEKPEDVKENYAEDEVEQEAKEEEAMQEEQPLKQEVEGDGTEEQEEDDTEAEQDEELTGQSEEQVAGETAEEEVARETVDGQVLDESLEEEETEEVVESLETVEEESAELNSEGLMHENVEDE